jgi:acetate kinase
MKYQLFDMTKEVSLAKGLVDRMGTPESVVKSEVGGVNTTNPVFIKDFRDGISYVLDSLLRDKVISNVNEIDAFAHKLAFGGPKYVYAHFLTEDVLKEMEEYIALLPVHTPPMLSGVRLCQKVAPSIPQIGVFETGFHETVPEHARIYGVPGRWHEEYGIRKFGFHGTSHKYVSEKAPELLGRRDLKIVSCHLGSGTSVAAILNGKSMDISSGLTPQSGTIMSTRPGDFDPWAILYVMEKEGSSVDEINRVLTKEAGLKGISGISGDLRDLKEAAALGNEKASLALSVFFYQVKKYIGAFAAVMNGLDVLIFTGGIGERDPETRRKITENMNFFGIELDEDKNENLTGEGVISKESSRVWVLVIQTNEELVVAREARQLLASRS